MDISKYWSLPRSGQGSQDEIRKAATALPETLKIIDIRKVFEALDCMSNQRQK